MRPIKVLEDYLHHPFRVYPHRESQSIFLCVWRLSNPSFPPSIPSLCYAYHLIISLPWLAPLQEPTFPGTNTRTHQGFHPSNPTFYVYYHPETRYTGQ